ncbi:MAG: hypothetical protein WC340_11135 [Kiritimatiellia bacterium]
MEGPERSWAAMGAGVRLLVGRKMCDTARRASSLTGALAAH